MVNSECESDNVRKVVGIFAIAIVIILILVSIALAFVFITRHLDNGLDSSKPIEKRRINIRGGGIRRDRSRPILPNFSTDSTAGSTIIRDSEGNLKFRYVGDAMEVDICGDEGTNSYNDNGRCRCIAPYWGPTCQNESYSNNYIALGNVDITQAGYEQYKRSIVHVNNLEGCSNMCDNDDNCVGLYYDINYCSLLHQSPSFEYDKTPEFRPLRQSNLYIKKKYRPVITDRVFLYQGILPLRYWIDNPHRQYKNSDLIALEPGLLYNLPFIPDNWINDTRYNLAYSDTQFTSIHEAKYIQRYNEPFIPQLYNWVMLTDK